MLDLHVANALFSCDEQGNQGWEESHCSKNSKGLVKNYGLASLPLVRIKPSLWISLPDFMVRLWIGTNLCLLWWISVSLGSRRPLNTNRIISFLLLNLKCKTFRFCYSPYLPPRIFLDCYSRLGYATMPVNFSIIICDFGLTSIHCKNKKQRVHGRFKKEKKKEKEKKRNNCLSCLIVFCLAHIVCKASFVCIWWLVLCK